MKTDLERLHLIHETLAAGITPPRRAGRTFYECHILCGTLLITENETILVWLKYLDRVRNFVDVLMPILKEYDIEFDRFDRSCYRMIFKNNSNMVKFVTDATYSQGRMYMDPTVDGYKWCIEDPD